MNGGRLIVLAIRALLLLAVFGFPALAQGRNPVILIPGVSGSELKNSVTGERVWFRALRAESDDLNLPISPNIAENHDLLVPGDVLRTIKIAGIPVTDVYGGLIEALTTRAGYHEEKWDAPSDKAGVDSLYVFPYDWRLDNVENARRLVRQVEDLKLRLKKPGLKFDIIAHSMGGIISRYAAMYGDTDLPDNGTKAVPAWPGSRNFDKIILMGTPNEGSALALSTLINGFTVGGVRIDLPFVKDSSKFMVFTMPALYELMPAPNTLKAYDDRLEPLEVDLYDPKVWSKYGWNAMDDKLFATMFSTAEQAKADKYFAAVLARAKRLHEALAASPGTSGGVSFYVLGAECRSALDSIVIYRDKTANKWRTLFRPRAFTRTDGRSVTEGDLKKVMMSGGDGVVTRRSLESATQSRMAGKPLVLSIGPGKFVCEEHTKLPGNKMVQDHIIDVLSIKNITSTADTASR